MNKQLSDIEIDTSSLQDGDVRFTVQGSADVVVVKFDNQVFAYKNVCPHSGLPLNAKHNEVAVTRGQYLVCSSHGAIFEAASGKCIAGPCNGASLQAVPIKE